VEFVSSDPYMKAGVPIFRKEACILAGKHKLELKEEEKLKEEFSVNDVI
jgi:hypothetical protein